MRRVARVYLDNSPGKAFSPDAVAQLLWELGKIVKNLGLELQCLHLETINCASVYTSGSKKDEVGSERR